MLVAFGCAPRASDSTPDVVTLDAASPVDVAPLDVPSVDEPPVVDVPPGNDVAAVEEDVVPVVDRPADVPAGCMEIDIGSRVGMGVATGDTTDLRSYTDSPCGSIGGGPRAGSDVGEAAILWVAPATDVYTFQTAESEFDTILSLREGRCTAREVTCNDDVTSLNQTSRITLPVPMGRALAIVIDGRGAGGPYRLDILPSGGVSCPAQWIACGGRCVDPANDPTHCGACGVRCASGEVCLGARCGTRTTSCGGSNSTVPCSDGFCPTNSNCTADFRCACRAGFVAHSCDNVPCTGCMRNNWWCAPLLCAPRCEGRNCGANGCGGSCGTCPSGQACDDVGRCQTGLDPCRGVPSGGVCTGTTTLDLCATPTGSTEPRVTSYACATGERCVMAQGVARCVLQAECVEGASRCQASAVQRCVGGRWTSTACPAGCLELGGSAQCATSVATRTLTGVLQYQYRVPDATRAAWSGTPSVARGQSVLAVSYRGTQPVDSTVTAEGASAGAFTLRVPEPAGADDSVVFVALRGDDRGGARYAVLDPGLVGSSLPAGCVDELPGRRLCTVAEVVPAAPRVWSVAVPLRSVPAGGAITIPLTASGPLRIFEQIRLTYGQTRTRYARDGLTLGAWFSPGVEWSCGNCFLAAPPRAAPGGLSLASQFFLGGGAEESWWSDATLQHELGHWVMESYGGSPDEGGPHYLGSPTLPGQAWSEGWATFHGASVRNDTIYYATSGVVRSGALTRWMFWFDVDARRYSDSRLTWSRPTPAGGLLQRMDENEVSAMLWRLSRTARGPEPVLRTLAAERVALPRRESPNFERGYTQHRWEVDREAGTIIESTVRETGRAAPMFADMLDALRCTGGFSAAEVDAVTEPSRAYPYPSAAPICRPTVESPLALSWSSIDVRPDGHVTLTAELVARGDFAHPVTFAMAMPADVTLVAGVTQDVVGPLAAGDVVRRSWTVRYDRVPATDATLRVDGEGPGIGFHGVAPYRFGRVERAPVVPVVAGPVVRYRGHDLGRPSIVTVAP